MNLGDSGSPHSSYPAAVLRQEREQIMNHGTSRLALATCALALVPALAAAQSRPAVHWSTFDKAASRCACHLFAKDALRAEGLDQILEDTGSVILAANSHV